MDTDHYRTHDAKETVLLGRWYHAHEHMHSGVAHDPGPHWHGHLHCGPGATDDAPEHRHDDA